jgi:hypothetical protein
VVLGCSLIPADRSNPRTASSNFAEGPYSSSPNHPWNRVHRALFVRTDANGHEEGLAALDPLLWPASTFLVRDPRRAEVADALQAFVDANAAALVRDSVRRAVFQRDLWTVFDWLSQPTRDASERATRADLERRLARVMGQVALTEEEIRALPDNLAQATAAGKYPTDAGDLAADGPFLPADLLGAAGDWVALEAPCDPSFFSGSLVPIHAEQFAGRSALSVHLRVPGGRAKALEYLERLAAVDAPRVAAPPDVVHWFEPGELPKPVLVLNPDTPQLPAGSAVALVRRMLLVDRQGRLLVSPLVESVQIRLFRSFGGDGRPEFRKQQRLVEFVLDRERLFAGDAGGLRAIGSDESVFETFATKGYDPFESPMDLHQRSPHFDRCVGCHGAPGIFSVQSYTRINSGPGTQLTAPALLPTARLRAARLADVDAAAISFKSQRHDWGVLETLLASH